MDRDRLWEQIARRVNNVKHSEVCALLEAFGWRHARTTGSHYIFSMPGKRPIPVPKHGVVPPFVVRQVLAVTKEDTEDVEDVEQSEQ